MTELNAAIVEQYAEHLSGKAASSVLSFALVGIAGGAALGAIPGHLSHSLLANGVNYFAVLLGALAGGIAGRSLGDKRAIGLRQLQVEELLLQRAPSAAAAMPPLSAPALAPVPVPVPAPVLVPSLAPPPAPVAAPPPAEPVAVPTVAFPTLQPAGPTAPPVVAPAPAPAATAPALPVAPPAPPPVRAVPAGPQLVEEEPAMPPLSY
jgi:hypothetical protein